MPNANAKSKHSTTTVVSRNCNRKELDIAFSCIPVAKMKFRKNLYRSTIYYLKYTPYEVFEEYMCVVESSHCHQHVVNSHQKKVVDLLSSSCQLQEQRDCRYLPSILSK